MTGTDQPVDLCTSVSEDGTHCELKPGHEQEYCQRTYNNRVVRWKFVSPWNRKIEATILKEK